MRVEDRTGQPLPRRLIAIPDDPGRTSAHRLVEERIGGWATGRRCTEMESGGPKPDMIPTGVRRRHSRRTGCVPTSANPYPLREKSHFQAETRLHPLQNSCRTVSVFVICFRDPTPQVVAVRVDVSNADAQAVGVAPVH